MKAVMLGVVVLGLGASVAHAQPACEPQRLLSPPEVPGSMFGFSVATNGRFWFVGDRSARTLCSGTAFSCGTGAVQVYELIDGSLVWRQSLVPDGVALGENFGHSLAAEGDRLVIGSLLTRWPGRADWPGAVFVYEYDGEEWREAHRIEPPAEVTSGFGYTVALHGDEIATYANRTDRVYMYRLEGGAWQPSQTIIPDKRGATLEWFFGGRKVISDDWLFIGATQDELLSGNGGSVHIYHRLPDGTFEPFQVIRADTPMRLGSDIASDGTQLFVGAQLAMTEFENQGAAFVYEFDGERWAEVQKLTRDGGRYNEVFGWTLDVDGDTLLITGFNEATSTGRGAVHRFRRGPDGLWRQIDRLVPNPPTPHARGYGQELVLRDNLALIGSPNEHEGAAYFFDLACDTCEVDLDADGSLTIFDFLAFLNLFQDGDTQADFDGDGELTIFDLLAFQSAFDAGCE